MNCIYLKIEKIYNSDNKIKENFISLNANTKQSREKISHSEDGVRNRHQNIYEIRMIGNSKQKITRQEHDL